MPARITGNGSYVRSCKKSVGRRNWHGPGGPTRKMKMGADLTGFKSRWPGRPWRNPANGPYGRFFPRKILIPNDGPADQALTCAVEHVCHGLLARHCCGAIFETTCLPHMPCKSFGNKVAQTPSSARQPANSFTAPDGRPVSERICQASKQLTARGERFPVRSCRDGRCSRSRASSPRHPGT